MTGSRIVFALAAILSACAPVRVAETAPPAPPREAQAENAFVIAANPLAAEAGRAILARGGSAADAALAVQAMLSLVEPQSSGVGGGGFVHYYDARQRTTLVYDGREAAPAQASPEMFLGADGKPLPFAEAVVSGRSTGVPGAIAALKLAHEDHGRLPWNSLFRSAETLAREGFTVTPRLERMVHGQFPQNRQADVRAYFAQGPGGRLVRAGDRLVNPAYANFLSRLARGGPAALYSGSTAARIVERTRQGALPGSLTLADMAGYRAIRRDSLCRPWRTYIACVPPPPSSGVALLQLLAMLERTEVARRGPGDPVAWFQFAEASRLMYADRDRFVGDPAFAHVPVEGLLDPAYVESRARMIGATAMPPPDHGQPSGAQAAGMDRTMEPAGTSHFIVRDHEGNVVSMTTTVESIFGSGRMVDGFFLNNQLTDFSFDPRRPDGAPAANAVAPGKRPRSSMVPMILMTPDRRFAGAIGSAGGNAILAYVAKSLVAAVGWGLPMQDAIAAPNLVARGSNFQGEVSRFPKPVLDGLAERGIVLRPGQGEDSGVHGVLIRSGQVDGGFDPRREGAVLLLPPR